ncbi:hypothetical protein CK203_025287 [Vitis vinifera]|uniref:Uncharacterized protein n=1 Tax=Vitis vinifera TaxID=29760 RepID=A0A438IZK6_VITVI|nr:hypothetical protein CK203_025287 [Vitis vinifera]
MASITISEAPLPDFRALGYPEEPRLERRRHCREDFSLDKWHHLAQQDEILTETTPPTPATPTSVHMPEAIHSPPLSLRRLSAFIATLSTAQDSIIHQMATIRAHQDQIIATQTQHTTILHQIQQHLSMQTPLRHDRSAPSEPLVPDEESLPAEQPIPEEEIRAEPSHDPTHI